MAAFTATLDFVTRGMGQSRRPHIEEFESRVSTFPKLWMAVIVSSKSEKRCVSLVFFGYNRML